MSDKLKRFINLLEEIFELDKSNLDFGVYRIMNIRRSQIECFLSESLPKCVREALRPFAEDTSALTARIAEIEKQCYNVGIDVDKSKMADEYAGLKTALARGADLSSVEADVYSALYSFFSRYYEDGDFISKRRYKEDVYAIPYEGEEVKLYWANADQFYIKTAENLRDYTFVDNGKKIHFRLADATTEKNNNKESDASKRVFMLYAETPDRPGLKAIEESGGELVIRFVYDIPADKSVKYAEANLSAIVSAIQKDFGEWSHLLRAAHARKGKEDVSVIEKHLSAYVAKNTFDYFIHKDLRGFLTRELDFFIKSEVIHLDDIDTGDEKHAGGYIAKVRAIKRVGKAVIGFLAQIEDFQKKLWLKKKFVVETNWCMTLDRINESFYLEIISNAAQIREWVEMYAINEITSDFGAAPYSEPLTVDFLRQNGNLVLDTRHFSGDFKDRLAASIDDLDEQTGGVMLNGDNFQSMSLLLNKYRQTFDCIYIDPPYNTDASKILYKNNYEHSSWLSLMSDRLAAGKALLKETGIQATAIDEYELRELYSLLLDLYSRGNNAGIIAVRSNPSGRPRTGGLALSHEYAIISKNSDLAYVDKQERSEEQAGRYGKNDGQGEYEQRNFRREGSNSDRENGIRQWYPIYVREDLSIRVPDMAWNNNKGDYDILEQPDGNETVVYPINDDGREKNWRWSWENVKKDYSQFYALHQKSGIQVYYKYRPNMEGITPLTFWDDKRYSAVENGTKLLKEILPGNTFSYPKSLYAVADMLKIIGLKNKSGSVIDYFAGSGTTGHAVIKLNREDGGRRKYLLVEMGEYFRTVTLPRMKKAIYSADWKSGKPQSRGTGVSHIMKYLILESYEDALSNVALDDKMNAQLSLFGDEYLINYMFPHESRGSMLRTDDFRNPFAYKLNIAENNETKKRVIDLCETFNYLIGLRVTRQSRIRRFDTAADNKAYEGSVELTSGSGFCFKQYEGKLPDGKRALIIWRTVTDDILRSNAALDAYFVRYGIDAAGREYDVIYINCDNNLENLRGGDGKWKVRRIEPVFKAKMFEAEE